MSATLVMVVVATLLVCVLALLAQRARKSRSAEITLVVSVSFLSFLVAAVGLVSGLGLLATAASGEAPIGRGPLAAAGVGLLAVGVAGIALCVPPLRKLAGRPPRRAFWADPPVFLALWLSLVVLANNAVSFLIFVRTPEVGELFPTGRLTPGAVLMSQLPFLAVALAGVGLGVSRNFRDTLSRLGYGGISPRQLGVVVLFVISAFVLSLSADALFRLLQPELYRQVGEISDQLFNTRGLTPVSVLLFGLLVGVGAGLGEETLFRGAVQPVLGIVPTSVLFASMHVQYGPSLLLGYVFLLSVGLGLLRKRINTTASFLAHAGYNTLGIILPYFFGV
ncbi:MAG: CPBP family intramembrane glutamic endopeptidase [Actinomycetota bacterium]